MIQAAVFAAILASCTHAKLPKQEEEVVQLPADSLVRHIGNYNRRLVKVEGTVIHICGVDGLKLKLRTDGGAIVKVIPSDLSSPFDRSLLSRRVRVEGFASELRTDKGYLDSLELGQVLLCHIDQTPCTDTAWVNDKVRRGVAAAMVKRDSDRLRDEMAATSNSYLTRACITAQRIEAVEEETKKLAKVGNCGLCALCFLCFRS